jgi:hypothetical protein
VPVHLPKLSVYRPQKIERGFCLVVFLCRYLTTAKENDGITRDLDITSKKQKGLFREWVSAVSVPAEVRACSLRDVPIMEYYCQRCDRYRSGDGYRVMSEEFGVTRLDIIVCYDCYTDARRLGLLTAKVLGSNSADESFDTVRRQEQVA